MMDTPVSELSGYAFTLLREGDFPLYRGSGDSLVPVLLVTAEDASLACLNRLEHEYALRAELDIAWAARPVAMSRYHEQLTLVLEDPGGEPLDRRLGGPLGISEFLRVAIPLAGALRRVHARGIIHKDIKPANVLVNVASGGVWLTGFGIAVHVPRERQAAEAPEVIAGTFAYMAPEQTGRMNRSIDARSDLYSLGVTFYEMLTGTLPFTATDPMEWVHCHIARQPTPPDERTPIPGPISAIVMKLLAKTADERYQTAAGVEADLGKCLAAWESGARIDPFPLATQDAPDRLLIPERLYGRAREIEALLASFDRVVANGTTEFVLISGYSGIGKSSVVHELHKALVPPRGLFASGKFDQYQRNIPYATLAEAFKSLVRSLLGRSDAELRRWREALREAVGPNAQLIVNLIPELELVIGQQEPVPDLPPREAQNRFRRVFGHFLGVFARPEHPLALFLDDLQWLDAATLDFLEHVITHAEVGHLLLVGAYRDNEVGPAHPLMRTLEAIRKTDARVQEIVLAPLGLEDVGQLVADALHCELGRARPLAQLIREKTGGNPFFAIQFFSALAEEGLLAFDSGTRAWQWDLDSIRARSYSDNVVDLMAEKLKRLSANTQEALKQFACLGNVATIDILTLVHGEAEATTHAALWEAVHAGLVFRLDGAYKFLHDRIQQAAYSLIPEELRADMHLGIGRVLLSRIESNELAEGLFDVANQFNRGTARLVERNEKAQAATINLRAGRKAKASAAYASACAYFSAGMALLDEWDWRGQYELTFNLWLERAECEFQSGNFEKAEQLIGELLGRATSKIDQAAVYQVKVLLHTVKSENPQAVASALTCLRLFGIDLPAHPTQEQVRAEYETVWRNLEGRPIESLIDLPLMIDPELQAAMRLLSALFDAVYFTDFHLLCLHLCRVVNISLQHGTTGAFAHACGWLGAILGPVFHRYRDGCAFGKLACDLVERYSFVAYRPKTYLAMEVIVLWTQPIATALRSLEATFRAGTETGDLTVACYSRNHTVIDLLLRGDPLEEVWRESEHGLEFVRKAGFRDVADLIVSQQRLIAAMQGRTATVSTFSDAEFDEAAFEARLTDDRMSSLVCGYWIIKLQARFLAGDYVAALAASHQAKPLLWAFVGHVPWWLGYSYYTALTVAALYESASADKQAEWRDLLTAHREQLREWAENYPPTFADKHALVSAEIARLDGRDPDAMHLYEDAIRSARENRFVQNEGLAHEVAARFYAARGFETIAHAYLRNARHCYLRWGALGKVRQLDQRYQWLREKSAPYAPTATIGAAVEQLDLDTVVKASQAVSGEIELGKLIETLMRIAVEHAGAERGLLIIIRNDEPRIEAQATSGRGTVEVTLRHAAVTSAELPEAVLHTVIRTRESVILDDAVASALFSADVYVQQRRPRSVLCLPLVKQAKLVGALYLENNLTSRAFTPGRIAVLELLASQAAISLENAVLYSDLQHENSERKRAEEELRRSESYLSGAQRLSRTGSFGWRPSSGKIYWSEETFRIFEFDRAATPTVDLMMRERIHPEDAATWRQVIERAAHERQDFAHEYRLRMPDGRLKHLQVVAQAIRTDTVDVDFVGAVKDVTEEKWAQGERDRLAQRLRQAEKMEAVGRLAGGVAHDFNNVLVGVFAYGEMVFDEAPRDSPLKRYAQNVLIAATRGRDLVEQILSYSRSQSGTRVPVDVVQVVKETIELIRGSLPAGIRLEASTPESPLIVQSDATQLHRVVMNLCSNAIQAMRAGGILRVLLESVDLSGERALSHGTLGSGRYLRLIVEDSGSGMEEATLARIFEPFFTTKEVGKGTGLGLSLVYAIIADSGGAIDVQSVPQQGSTFTIYLPRSQIMLAAGEAGATALPRGHGERVLLIDDEGPMLAASAELLSQLGYEAVSFSDGRAALAAFDATPERFDAVVTDEIMPGLTGTKLARLVRQRRPGLPVVLVSGHGGASLTQDALATGLSEWLTKPLQARDTATTLARVLHRSA
jgi:predicted ATPase/signal transduction histidine kinase/GAF domain-containing protein/CheY-like chemotaxis protein